MLPNLNYSLCIFKLPDLHIILFTKRKLRFLFFDCHKLNVIKTKFHFLYSRSILFYFRSYLSEESTIALIHAFITCRLDNGNALLYGLPKYQTLRLQSVQNCAARLVKRCPKSGHNSPLLSELHWLPVEHCTDFKILLVFKSLNNLAPSYLSDLLTLSIPSHSLRSSKQSLLVVPRSIQKSYGDRAFAVAAPQLKNALPIHIRQPGFSLAAFKKCLKTYLFKKLSFQIFCDFM